MKAVRYTRYGGPDVLNVEDVDKPVPAADEVLIRVHAASVNPYDWRHFTAQPFFIRMSIGLLRPKDPRLGADAAGVVEAVGSEVARFKPGDEVLGEIGYGAFAEYATSIEKKLAIKPPSVSWEQAAAIPMVGLTALQSFPRDGSLQPGQRVLVNGASGGIGHIAVQIAKSMGAEVTGVCSARNHDMVRSLGADHLIDYTTHDFTREGTRYDLIVDTIGNRTARDLSRALTPTGRAVVSGFTTLLNLINIELIGGRLSSDDGQQITQLTARIDADDLAELGQMIADGRVTPVIDRTYTLDRIRDAITYSMTKRAAGKIIVVPNGA